MSELEGLVTKTVLELGLGSRPCVAVKVRRYLRLLGSTGQAVDGALVCNSVKCAYECI